MLCVSMQHDYVCAHACCLLPPSGPVVRERAKARHQAASRHAALAAVASLGDHVYPKPPQFVTPSAGLRPGVHGHPATFRALKALDWSGVDPTVRVVPTLLLSTAPVVPGAQSLPSGGAHSGQGAGAKAQPPPPSRPVCAALYSVGPRGNCVCNDVRTLAAFERAAPLLLHAVCSQGGTGAVSVLKCPDRGVGTAGSVAMVVGTGGDTGATVTSWFHKACGEGEAVAYRTLAVQPFVPSAGGTPWYVCVRTYCVCVCVCVCVLCVHVHVCCMFSCVRVAFPVCVQVAADDLACGRHRAGVCDPE